jgi:hypothetical protein
MARPATGWGTQNNGYGFYHEGNGSAPVSGVQLHQLRVKPPAPRKQGS